MSLADKQIPPLAHASRQRPRTQSRDELVLQKAQRNAKKAKAQREFLPSNIDALCTSCGLWHQGKKVESCKSGCGQRLLYIPKILKPWRILSDQYGYEAANFACRGMCHKVYVAWSLFGCDCPNERRDFERHPVLYYCRICCYNYKTGQSIKLDDVFYKSAKRPELVVEQQEPERPLTFDEAMNTTRWFDGLAFAAEPPQQFTFNAALPNQRPTTRYYNARTGRPLTPADVLRTQLDEEEMDEEET